VRDRQLFNGVLLGITGLLAVFLTAVFAANHKIIFPAAALVAWCVLAHLTVDFGFFHKLFQLRPEDSAIYRAATEAAMAASLVMFVHTFLKLGLSHALVRMVLGVWIAGQLALVAVAVIDPRLASTFARLSFVAIGAIGAVATLFLALRGQDRALAFVPTWLLFLVWVFGIAVVITGRLSSEIAVSSLMAGLVLIVVLIAFTVTQFAFRSNEPTYGVIAPERNQLSGLAVEGSGAGIFEWTARANDIKTSPTIETIMGLQPGDLSGKVDAVLAHIHEADRERFRLMLASAQERAAERIHAQFRLRHLDKSSRWFVVDAARVPGADARNLRYVGLLRDITDTKRAHDRLLQDAVHCSLTGMPNRALFLDRLRVVMARARSDERLRPAIIFIDIDKFKNVNSAFGVSIGDSLLLTIARRLQRHVTGRDTLARVGGDQFAILYEAEKDPAAFAREAEQIRRSLRAPIKMGGRDIVLTGSLGIAIFDGDEHDDADLLKEAEIAMVRAKRGGADRIELFRPEMRADRESMALVEADLRKAVEKGQLRVAYQPIIYLPTEELAGFEALVRWEHPLVGVINPALFDPIAHDSDLMLKIGSYVLARACQDAARWHKELPRSERPLFVSVNIQSRQLFRPELVRDVRQILDQGLIPRGTLRLEVTESLAMENPEQSAEILESLRGVGAELALDEFGSGYSSPAFLQRFPFTTVKIDRSIIQSAVSGDAAGVAVARSMVAIANELHKQVVAEGVENPEDVTFLRAMGCAYAQGYYYGEPMPDRDVLQLLKIVRKSERGLIPHGFFRMGTKRRNKSAYPSTAATDGAQGENTKLRAPKVKKTIVKATSSPERIPNGVAPPPNAEIIDPLLNATTAPSFPPLPPMLPPAFADTHLPTAQPAFQLYAAPPPIASEQLAPNPLSSLQAGLDAAAMRPAEPAASNAIADDLSVVFNTLVQSPLGQNVPLQPVPPPHADNGNGHHHQPPLAPRVRTPRPAVDLSKLPPGIAASLAKLAGNQPTEPTQTAPPVPLKRTNRG
jgi:diguanylate cyclase (GGDEF)-like protein/PAS domain S-box-containing protein